MLPKSLFVTGLAALLVLSACTFTVQPEMDAAPPAPAEAPAEPAQPEEIQPEEIQPSLQAAFILPDGNRCLFAGTGATMAFDGKRVNYTCDVAPEGKIVAILDDPVQPETGLTEWQVEVAVISPGSEGFTLDSSEVIQFTAWQIDLAGDVTCLHAGFGATFGFDDERVNYTCEPATAGATGPTHGGFLVLLGQPANVGEGVWHAHLAEAGSADDGWEMLDDAQVEVAAISGLDPLAAASEGDGGSLLAGTSWQWIKTEYGDDSVTEAADPARYTLTFNEDGSLAALLDCNSGMGSYTEDTPVLTIGPLTSTLMGCAEDSQAAEFAQDLEAVVSYVIQDGNLYLALFADAGIMTFEPLE